jgi:glycerol-3-phosphate O-acyltransferase
MHSHHEAVARVADNLIGFFNRVFTEVNVEGPALDPLSVQRHPHMLVCTHRSHIDYFLGGLTLFAKGFKNMRFAAGGNLTRLPYIGPRFKAFGAFTVEREIAFERNYVKNLCNCVVSMMDNHEAVIVFPEGGRSYSGGTLEVKNGILGASVLLQARNPREEVLLLPMAISYECPPDARYFSMLLAGKKLRKRTQPFYKRLLGNLLYYGADILAFVPFCLATKLRRTYGAVYIDYEEPVPVCSLVDIEANKASETKDEFFAHRVAMQKVGDAMQHRFLTLFRILPQHLLAVILLDGGPMTASQAAHAAASLVEKLRVARVNLKSIDPLSPSAIVEQGVKGLLRLGAIKSGGGVLSVKKASVLDYCASPARDACALIASGERS